MDIKKSIILFLRIPHFSIGDAFNGNILWKYNCGKTTIGGLWPTIYLKRVVFNFRDTILALDPYTGSKLWFINYDWHVSAHDNKIFHTWGHIANDSLYSHIQAFSIFNGEKVWEKVLSINDPVYASIPPAPPISYPGILWYNDPKYIYALNVKDGEVLYRSEEIFQGHNMEACIFFPILYKDYVIISRYSALSVYKGDTIQYPPPPQSDTISKFYVFYEKFLTPVLYIYLHKKDYVLIDIFDEIGRKIKNIYKGELDAGEHRIYLDKDMSSGKYFIILKTPKYKKNFKFMKIRK